MIIIALLIAKNVLKYFDMLLQNYLRGILEYTFKCQIGDKVVSTNYLQFLKVDSGKLININNDIENMLGFYIN